MLNLIYVTVPARAFASAGRFYRLKFIAWLFVSSNYGCRAVSTWLVRSLQSTQ